jgi:hypothetical protein
LREDLRQQEAELSDGELSGNCCRRLKRSCRAIGKSLEILEARHPLPAALPQ